MDSKKLAIIIPGMGYTKDRPLLYYAGKLLTAAGYELLHIEFTNLPKKIRGNRELILQTAIQCYDQASTRLASTDFSAYTDILFVGKSIGTIVAARYIAEHNLDARQIWYTPLQETLDTVFSGTPSVDPESILAFIGTADPWSDIPKLLNTAAENHLDIHVYEDCNHSLETPDVDKNIEILRDVMGITRGFVYN
ncbi:MAG: alpha/beta hydrolase [Clostridiales bacterium]|nr:alpha/beta hydrolase [Clostridiales bacterium]